MQHAYSVKYSREDYIFNCVQYVLQEDTEVDLNASVDSSRRKLIDAAGAGTSLTSPGWLTELGRLYGGNSVSHALI